MNIYIEFGRRLAFIRQNSKLSQSQIAQKLNIAQSTYAGYEKGVRKIPLEIIVQLSKILNISPTILILGDEANIVKDYTISEQESKGRRFESCRGHHCYSDTAGSCGVFYFLGNKCQFSKGNIWGKLLS